MGIPDELYLILRTVFPSSINRRTRAVTIIAVIILYFYCYTRTVFIKV